MMAVIRLSVLTRKGKELKAPHHASAAATRDYITIRDIVCLSMLRPHRETLNQFRPSVPVWSETLWPTFVTHVAISA